MVKNRGPITAKITASGSHSRYCDENEDKESGCRSQFSLVAWKFAGDAGTVHGTMEEQFDDGGILKVDVDCMVRMENEALVGGIVTQIPKTDKAKEELLNRRAYVKVIDNSSKDKTDFISEVKFWLEELDEGFDCASPEVDRFELGAEFNVINPRVKVCSKHGDWEGCLEKASME